MTTSTHNNLLAIAIRASFAAGKEILEVYKNDFEVNYKEDQSPLTLADQAAHKVISAYLEETGFPLLSEEGRHLPYDERKAWDKLWIVDPLDGTKEFIKRNGEFTVNIAFVERNKPTMGVIFCPTLNILYFADESIGGSYKAVLGDDWTDQDPNIEDMIQSAVQLPQKDPRDHFTVVASRSHLNDDTKSFVSNIEKQVGKIQFISRGSSLKLCMVAEGKADLYPRFAPTSEWDTAAGQAIVEYSGGKVILQDTGKAMSYNKADLLNPWFLVMGKGIEDQLSL